MRCAHAHALAAVAALFGASAARAQSTDSELSVTAAFAHARPPAHTDVPSAQYGLLAARARVGSATTSAFEGALDLGGSATEGAARWLQGGAALIPRVSCVIAVCGVRLEGFGVHYPGSAPYTAGAARVQPELVFGGPASALVRVSAAWTRGQWQADIPGTTPTGPGGLLGGGGIPQPAQHRSGDLDVRGGALSAGFPIGALWLQANAEAWRSNGGALPGDYRGAGVQTAYVTGPFTLSLGAAVWDTPAGVKNAYRAATALSLGSRVALRVEAGQTVADPLYGTEGSFTSTVGITWTMGGAHTVVRSTARSAPATPMRKTAAGQVVRFTLRNASAQSVAVAGDFNGWKTVPLQQTGDTFSVEIPLPAGVHHYAFLVDDKQWTVPNDAPGVVDDGWGRKNATIVVEGQ